MKNFTIAHISDIHLPLENLRFSKLSLCNKRFLSFLSWKKRRFVLQKNILDQVMNDVIRNKPDLLLITGDLTNLALPEEFQQAAEWLHNIPIPNIRIVPGNHDALVKTNWHNSHAYWLPWTKAYSYKDYPTVSRFPNTAIIGVNSAVPTLPLMASGHIKQTQLERLKTILRQTKAEGLFRIVILHHPPIAGIVTERKALRNREKLQEILLHEGAEMILYGHVHKTNTHKFMNTDIPLLGISSASATSSRPQRQAAWRKIVLQPSDNQLQAEVYVRSLEKNNHFKEHRCFYINHNLPVKPC